MTGHLSSRRSFLHAAGILSGSALAVPLRSRAERSRRSRRNTLDARRAQMGGTPIQTTKLGERLVMLSGPGGNVVVLHGPDGKIVVDGFVKPAWPSLKAALDAIDGSRKKGLEISVAFYFLTTLLQPSRPPNDFCVGVEDCRGAGGQEESEAESPSVRNGIARGEANIELICEHGFRHDVAVPAHPIQLLGGSL